MKAIQIHKASPLARDVESIHLVLDKTIQDAQRVDLEAIQELWDNDAHALHDILRTTLPGGTYDRLLALMLRAKASDFVVSYETARR